MQNESGQSHWAGRKHETPRVRHRWEEGWSELQDHQFVARPRRLQRRLIILILLSAVLTGLFVYFIVYKPTRTPFLAFAPTRYEWPVPPNAWAHEDLQSIRELDRSNLRIVEIVTNLESRDQSVEEFDRQLRRLGDVARGNEAVVIHLSMHGAVDESGEPCLIPPGASALDASTWIPVRQMLQQIKAHESLNDVNKLLILDCQKVRANWRLGVLQNTFTDRLESLINSEQVPQLVVLTAADSEQVAWTSPDLRSSVMGRYLKLGLAGAADHEGDGDGRVSVLELHDYLDTHVSQWAIQNRGEPQSPRLFPRNASDFVVTWAVNGMSLKSMEGRDAIDARVADTISAEQLGQLWKALELARSLDLVSTDPLGVGEIEQQLLWLEQLSSSGNAYKLRARQLFTRLESRLQRFQADQATSSVARSIAARPRLSMETVELPTLQLDLHTLPLCEYFSTLDAETLSSFRDSLLQAAAAPREADLNRLAGQYEAERTLNRLAETQFLYLCARNDTQELWPSSNPIRTALERRLRVEELAVLGDLRVKRWIWPKLESLDPDLRAAEDRLFAGEMAAGDAVEMWASLNQAYDELDQGDQSPLSLITRAMHQRDEAWAQFPYYAMWLCRPQADHPELTEQLDRHDKLLSTLQKGIDASWHLGEILSSSPNWEPERIAGLLEQVQATEQALAEIKTAFETQWRRLLDPTTTENAATLRQLQDVMIVPQIPWDQRVLLKQKLDALATQLNSPGTPQQTLDSTELAATETTDGSTTYRIRFSGAVTHPLLDLLRLQGESESEDAASDSPQSRTLLATLEGNGERSRQRLLAIHRQDLAGNESEASPPNSVRDELSRLERMSRIAAGLLSTPDDDASARLRNFDAQELLLWQANRTLGDFWGPLSSSVDRERPSYFEVAAEDYLNAARTIAPLRGELEEKASLLRDRLTRYRIAARRGVEITADAAIQVGQSDQFSVTVTVSRPSASTEATSLRSALPQGLATVLTRSLRATQNGTRTLLSIPLDSDTNRFELFGSSSDEGGRAFEAAVFFRGHEYSSPFIAQGLGGFKIDYRPSNSDSARVTLSGDRRKRSSILFVLDCSSSMGKRMVVEAVGESELPRLTLAKGALASMLDQLATRSDARVGVRFFGHRIGWSTTEPIQALVQETYTGEIPENLSPSEDVELVLPLGRFDSVEVGKVVDRMESVVAWGQSPLYLTLMQALGDFEAEDADTDKSIVVITDGSNYQFTPAGDLEAAPPLTLDSVLNAWSGKQIPVYIMGFGVSEEEDAAEFQVIADATNGQYYSIESGRDLLRTLQSRLGFGSYSVYGDGPQISDVSDADQMPLNSTVTLTDLRPGSQEFTLQFESLTRHFEVEGGESLEMFVSTSGNSISSVPYDQGLPVTGSLVLPGQPGRLTVRAHRPTRNGQAVTFPVSIQNELQHFTPRPREAWIEITPTVQGQPVSDVVYTFYDRNFQPDRPVPVLAWTANNWPDNADQATVHVWCRFADTQPIYSITVPEVLDNTKRYAEFRPVEGIRGVSFSVHTGETSEGEEFVKVVEKHGSDSAGVNQTKVQLALDPNLQARQVVHQFDAKNGLAIHTYFFRRGFLNRVRGASLAEIRFVTRNVALDGAWKLEGDRGLLVNIYGAGDRLPLDSATSVR